MISENLKTGSDASLDLNTLSLEEILEQVIQDLRKPVATVEKLSPTLRKMTIPPEDEENILFSQFRQSVRFIRDRITQAIRTIDASSEVSSNKYAAFKGVDAALFRAFLYELEIQADSLLVYSEICHLIFSEDWLEKKYNAHLDYPELAFKALKGTFKILKENKGMGLGSLSFDWKYFRHEDEPETDETKRQQLGQDILLQMAIGKFLRARFTKSPALTYSLYLAASELFEQAMELGPIPSGLDKYAKGAKYWVEIYPSVGFI